VVKDTCIFLDERELPVVLPQGFLIIPSPFTGEGEGGGIKHAVFTLPLIPSRQGRGEFFSFYALRSWRRVLNSVSLLNIN